jgi:hypothetical protein
MAREILSKRNFLDFESPEKDGKKHYYCLNLNQSFYFYSNSNKNYLLILPILIVYNPKVTNKMDEKCLKTSNFLEENYKARHAFF